jgi:hypothetical protein
VEGGTHFPLPNLVSSHLHARTHGTLRCTLHTLRVSFTLSLRLFSPFVLFLLYFHALLADSVRMYRTLILSILLLSLDIIGLRVYALQPEALIFAALAIATLPFFLSSALTLRGE